MMTAELRNGGPSFHYGGFRKWAMDAMVGRKGAHSMGKKDDAKVISEKAKGYFNRGYN